MTGSVVLGPYRELFAAPGALAFSAAGFVARMPIAMTSISIVLLVSSTTGSYATAGGVSASGAFAEALAGPQLARAADRLGQARVAVPALVVFVLGMVAFMACAEAGAPVWTLYVTASAGAAALPNTGSFVRARWAALYTGTRHLHTAYSLEATVDELIFVVGPVLATLLATGVSRLAGLGAMVLFGVTGTLALAAQRRTEPPPRGTSRHIGRSALRIRGMAVVVVVFLALGCLFGALEIVVVAYATGQGHRAVAGVILAIYASGSGIAGLVYGTLHPTMPLHRRFLIGVSAMSLSVLPLPFISSLVGLSLMFFVAGFTIAPTLATGVALVESLVASDRLTEGLSWLTTGIMLGVTAGTAVAGWVVDAAGPGRAFFVPVGSGAIAAGSAFVGASRLRPARIEESAGGRAVVEQLGG